MKTYDAPAIHKSQNHLETEIFKGEKKSPEVSEVWLKLQDYTTDEFKVAMGTYGVGLKSFLNSIDLAHPDVDNAEDKAFVARAMEALALSRFAINEKLDTLVPDLKKIFKLRLKSVKPHSQVVRLLKSADVRQEFRSLKKSQPITLRNEKSNWESAPSDFSLYFRNSDKYKDEVKRIEEHAAKYNELGCSSMYREVMKSIDIFKDVFVDSCYGFYKISMNTAALICAKMHSYRWHNGRIKLNEPLPSEITSGFSLSNGRRYFPYVYPAHELGLSAKMKKILNHLDAFPEACGKPLFDHHLFIVPGISDIKDLHLKLIKNKIISPILLGEKDGSCYFISHWR